MTEEMSTLRTTCRTLVQESLTLYTDVRRHVGDFDAMEELVKEMTGMMGYMASTPEVKSKTG